MARLIGIDVGTSGARAILMDERGVIQRSATRAFSVTSLQPGWAEQDPEIWWNAVCQCLDEIGWEADCIGVTGQMHGSVFLDENNEVIRPALLWCDQRTTKQVLEIKSVVGSENIRRITKNPPMTGFQLPKVLWLKENEPESFQQISKILLPKDYIVFKLTGTLSTDVSDASGTGNLDVENRAWSTEVTSKLGLSTDFFPPVFESSQAVGKTKLGVPVVAGAGDQAAGAVGVGAVANGIVSLSLGTSGVAFTCLDRPVDDESGSTHIFCHANKKWHAMGVMLACGGAVSWCRENFFSESTFDQMSKMAEDSLPGSDGLTFLPYLSGERCPHNDPFVRGSFLGLSTSHSKKDIARSVFEGVTFGLTDCLELVLSFAEDCSELRVTGGGSKSEFWMQLISDVTGKSCHRLAVDEGPAFGAAILAGVGVNIWPNVEEACAEIVRVAETYSPSESRYRDAYCRYRQVYALLKDWYHSPNYDKI